MGFDNLWESISNAAQEFKQGFDEGGSIFRSSNETDSKFMKKNLGVAYSRRTDDDFSKNRHGMNQSPYSFQYKTGVKLANAKTSAPSQTGVYILYLNGRVMKCGRAAYGQGVRWRFTQYYNLNYDNRARCGDYWSVNKENRDRVVVSWQCCPEAACKELEYKLFQKYGKGPWAERAPQSCNTNEWQLLI